MTDNVLRRKLTNRLAGGKPIIATYLTLGYPTVKKSIDAMVALGQNGADIIEIGIPFSDPIADGPIIQESSKVALQAGSKFNRVWDAVESIKQLTTASPLIMTYGNLVLQHGIEEFVVKSKKHRLEGLILPDVPPELYDTKLFDLNPIFLAAPNTSDKRVEYLSSLTGGFLYIVSKLSITGGEGTFDPRINRFFTNGEMNIPKLIGFGISSRNNVAQAIELGADGVIIGSELINQLGKVENLRDFVEHFKSIIEGI